MSIILKKGIGYSADFSSVDYPILDDSWTGNVSLYVAYPGAATISKTLVRVGNIFRLSLAPSDVLGLDSGVYYFISTMSNETLGVSVSSVEYATVTAIVVSAQPMTTFSMILLKLDGTPAGKETRVLVNSSGTTAIVLGWAGAPVSVSTPITNAVSGTMINTEIITTTTNAAGYVEFQVIKGQTVTVTCPYFGKTVTVNTTGLDSVDLSTFF